MLHYYALISTPCISKIKGDWNLIEYITSVDGKPFPPHAPYLCPEQRMSVTIDAATKRMNIQETEDNPLRS